MLAVVPETSRVYWVGYLRFYTNFRMITTKYIRHIRDNKMPNINDENVYIKFRAHNAFLE